jgi:iron complex outermembrane receptor protein
MPLDPRIIRATGQILRIDTSYINASQALTDGLDLNARQSWSLGNLGDLTATAEATWISRYIIQDTPTSPRRNVVGNRNFRTFARSLPAWRSNGSLGLQHENQAATATVRFIDSYADDQNANRAIKNQTTLDLQYAYNLAISDKQRVTMSLGALNVFDAAPPNVFTNAGYDSKVHDPRGRVLYLRIKTAWQ